MNNWQKWTETRNKSLSNVPKWLEDAIADYQKKNNSQSWSAAANEMLAIFANQNLNIEFDKDFERELYKRFDAFAESQQETVYIEDFLRVLIAPPRHGGDRKSTSQAKCPYCGHIQIVRTSDDECEKCGECEFIAIVEG